MKGQSLKKQTAVMTSCNILIRGLGFILRLITSRLLGAEALGVMELAGQAHMLALTPAAAGLPGAVSRLTAQREDREGILLTARRMAMRMGCVMGAALLVLSPWIAEVLGDERVLPSLVLFSPCVMMIGLSGVYRGYSMGLGNAWPPAFCEMAEQVVRLVLVGVLAGLLPRLTVAWRAAVPAFATVMGEGAGLMLIAVWLKPRAGKKRAQAEKELFRIALPVTMNRLSHTLLRTCCSVLIPLRLCARGLSHAEAISRMGMLNGMVMPMIFLPGMFTGALGTVSIPAVAKQREKGEKQRLTLRLLLTAAMVGGGCWGLLFAVAPLIGGKIYGLPEVGDLLRVMSPMAMLLSVQQVLGGIMMGEGLQRKAFFASLGGALTTLLLTYLWTASSMGIYGAGYANMTGHMITLGWCLVSFFRHNQKRP